MIRALAVRACGSAVSDSPSVSLRVASRPCRSVACEGNKRGTSDALSDIRGGGRGGGGAIKSGAVGQWVTGPASTMDFAELSVHSDLLLMNCKQGK